ncbi:chalcone isomerase family protein [Shewanella aestuarii]|uniref:Chalcone isomerase n=1 Tax=Shewanella aestuarii TaxID=1028752 RepID=A0A6G9QJA7_9GAMM|nr:chalcone isomerase family protein [Shewanella aestuarii]QIR13961.1 chalcone isomerase [Shewanella aestuarii]
MKILSVLSLTAALILSPIVNAKSVSGIELSESLNMAEHTLILNGAGVRSKFFMDLYVGSLYLPHHQTALSDVIEQPVAVIRLNITSGMITSDKMIEAINEGFDAATNGKPQALKAEIDQFMALFSAEIKKGDQFTFVLTKDQGVISLKNQQQQGEVAGEAFRQALLNIWLGDKPAQKSLKKAMLGN